MDGSIFPRTISYSLFREVIEMKEYGLYIDGQWVPSISERAFQTKSPTTVLHFN